MANYYGAFILIAMTIRHYLVVTNVIPSYQNKEKFIDLTFFLDLITIVLCMLICIVPEALNMAFVYCLSQYATVSILKEGKMAFKNIKALENMGRLDT